MSVRVIDLDLDLLRCFLTVVESGGFTRASKQLHLTQSAITLKIKRLEDLLERRLFFPSWLRKLGVAPLTRNSFRLRLSVLWEFALLHGWTGTNPLSTVAKAKVMDQPAGILGPEQLARLLEQLSPLKPFPTG